VMDIGGSFSEMPGGVKHLQSVDPESVELAFQCQPIDFPCQALRLVG
jgi:hypothetical protein